MRAVSNTARGKKATQQQRASILRQLEALEKCNTVQNPAESDMLCGKWALLYQGESERTGWGWGWANKPNVSQDARMQVPGTMNVTHAHTHVGEAHRKLLWCRALQLRRCAH